MERHSHSLCFDRAGYRGCYSDRNVASDIERRHAGQDVYAPFFKRVQVNIRDRRGRGPELYTGSGASIRMPGWEIAGKTGTAQVSELGSGGAKDHALFISFAPAYKPEISVVALIENSGFGAANAAPAAKGIYEAYLAKRDPNKPIITKDEAVGSSKK